MKQDPLGKVKLIKGAKICSNKNPSDKNKPIKNVSFAEVGIFKKEMVAVIVLQLELI